jgi:sodium-dependent dicarboxylate transporter 2/3/5
MAGYVNETYGIQIGFAQWMLVGVPLVVVALPLAWLLLTRVLFRVGAAEVSGGRAAVRQELGALGRVRPAERRVAVVFVLTALAWVVRPLVADLVPGLSDAGIAIAAGLVLFVTPAGTGQERLLDWETAEALPWGVLLLFGGGLSLAAAISDTGLALWIGQALGGLGALPVWLLVLAVTAVIVFLTELTSNTATAAAFLPVLGPLAVSLGQGPLLFVVPAALAASCAFMMPVATPPNAIVFGSGRVTMPQMARAGVWLNVLFIGLIMVVAYTLVPVVLGAG